MKVGLLLFRADFWVVIRVLVGMGSVAAALPAIAREEPMSNEFTDPLNDLGKALAIDNAEIPQLHESSNLLRRSRIGWRKSKRRSC